MNTRYAKELQTVLIKCHIPFCKEENILFIIFLKHDFKSPAN